MALPNYSYGTAATTFGKNPEDSYYALKDASGGGGNVSQWSTFPAVSDVDLGAFGISGELRVSGPEVVLGPANDAQYVVSNTAGSSVCVGENVTNGYIFGTDAGSTIRTPQMQVDQGNDRFRFTSSDGTVEIMDVQDINPVLAPTAPFVATYCDTTVGRPAGDVTVDALLKVQNGSGMGLGVRSAFGQVAAGGTIERVTAGTGSGVADITIDSNGDVTIAQDLTCNAKLTAILGTSAFSDITATQIGPLAPATSIGILGNFASQQPAAPGVVLIPGPTFETATVAVSGSTPYVYSVQQNNATGIFAVMGRQVQGGATAPYFTGMFYQPNGTGGTPTFFQNFFDAAGFTCAVSNPGGGSIDLTFTPVTTWPNPQLQISVTRVC